MCTLSWFRQPGGWQVFANRDELLVRRPELPAAVGERGGVRFVAPIDGDAGGTWILATERGVVLCLLNAFSGERLAPPGADRSRGEIPMLLASSQSAADAVRTLARLDTAPYRPFVVVAFDPGSPPVLARGRGGRVSIDDRSPTAPLVSSSLFTERVPESRLRVFREMADGPLGSDPVGLHLEFHRSHLPERGPRSVCLHRDDARTFSLTWVDATAERVLVRHGGQPCAQPLGSPIELRRRG